MDGGENYELDIDPKSVCRICLSQTGQLQNIFSNSIVDGYILSVPDIIAFTLEITVSILWNAKCIFFCGVRRLA